MFVHNYKKIASSVIKISDIEKLIKYFSVKFQKPSEFEIYQKNGFDYQYDSVDNFINNINLNIAEIKKIKMSFWGEKEGLTITIGRNEAYFNLSVKSESDAIEYSNYIEKIFKEKSWNRFLNESWSIIPIQLATGMLLALILFIFKIKNSVGIYFPILMILFFATIPLSIYLSQKYPVILFACDNKNYGRIFKQDLWKFLTGLVIIIFSAWVSKFLFG